MVHIEARIEDDTVYLTVRDDGKGIEDLETARQPLYTSKPELERSGMGFTIMENFMDEVEVESAVGKGTIVRMRKRIESANADSKLGDGVMDVDMKGSQPYLPR